MSILEEIFTHKRREVAAAKRVIPASELEARGLAGAAPPDFAAALQQRGRAPQQVERTPRLIAEVKHRSPSKGLLCPDFDPLRLAHTYAANGAAAISVLTDEKYFGGSLAYLQNIAQAHTIPLLRKDFIFDRYQLLEARAAGASAALLIAAMLDDQQLAGLITEAAALQLTPLVEVHTRPELDRALHAGARVIGINNRNLHTFTVSLQTTLDLVPHIPPEITIVAESGIKTRADVQTLAAAGVHAMLIGEGIVTAEDQAAKVRELSQTEDVPRPPSQV